jgi:pimeloyl-ACP methyl ester carboxylesterase
LTTTLRTIDLPAGTIEYQDSGGDKPPIVLLHGLVMDASLWADVIAELADDYRCIAPILPLGAHAHPMRPGVDLSLRGLARLTAEFLEQLELERVTLVGNDTGGAIAQLLICDAPGRIARLVLASCDAFDNFPPGLTGKTLVMSGKLPPFLFGAFMQQMRLRPLRRLPMAFGWLTKRGDAATARWIKALLQQPAIRRDAVRVLRAVSADPDLMLKAAECLPDFDQPALVVWAQDDRVMPPEHGHRLAELLPKGELVEVPDSYTLIPLDQPAHFARLVHQFASTSSAAGPSPETE